MVASFWSPCSFDFNPIDYYDWWAVEKDGNRFARDSLVEPMVKMMFENLPRASVSNAGVSGAVFRS